MTLVYTAVLNSRFNKLNSGGIDLLHKQNTPSRERRAIVDVTFLTSTYVEDGDIVDFSVIRKFKEVYTCNIINAVGTPFIVEYVVGTNSTDGLFKLYTAPGIEQVDATSTPAFTITCEIYGF